MLAEESPRTHRLRCL